MIGEASNGPEEGPSPGDRDSTLGLLYRQLDDAGVRLRRLQREASPYTRVETEMLKRRHDEIARQIRALIARRRKA